MHIRPSDVDNYSINDLLDKELQCDCGHIHSTNIKKVLIGQGVTSQIGELLKKYKYNKVYILSDEITWDIAAKNVADTLDKENIFYYKLILEGRVIPDEKRIGEIFINIPKDVDIIIAIGTGVICDIGKFFANKLNIDLMSVITAPSVDGFASQHAALVVNDLKVSFGCVCPKFLIGDVNVLKNAPMSMIIAGWCDIIGKYSAITDWKLSSIIKNEYYCDTIAEMVRRSVKICTENLDNILKREPEAIQNLMEALLLTGIAMGLLGNSRPASGSEHHLSHCWEMRSETEGWKLYPHGIQVGIGEVIVSKLYDIFRLGDFNFEEAIKKANEFDIDKWKSGVSLYFKNSSNDIIDEVVSDNRYSIDKILSRIKSIKDNWNDIQDILKEMPSNDYISNIMKKANAKLDAQEMGISKEEILKSILMAKEVRNKYTILGILDDLGILKLSAEEYINSLDES